MPYMNVGAQRSSRSSLSASPTCSSARDQESMATSGAPIPLKAELKAALERFCLNLPTMASPNRDRKTSMQ
eukprot:6624393-Alexandrium_andersonii.AAC.1